jgi:hypothetical protein
MICKRASCGSTPDAARVGRGVRRCTTASARREVYHFSPACNLTPCRVDGVLRAEGKLLQLAVVYRAWGYGYRFQSLFFRNSTNDSSASIRAASFARLPALWVFGPSSECGRVSFRCSLQSSRADLYRCLDPFDDSEFGPGRIYFFPYLRAGPS